MPKPIVSLSGHVRLRRESNTMKEPFCSLHPYVWYIQILAPDGNWLDLADFGLGSFDKPKAESRMREFIELLEHKG